MLFVTLTFSVLFGSIEAPGLGIGGRYMFTMAIGRLLRALNGGVVQYDEYRPNWGFMSFLADFLRPVPSREAAWINLLKKAGGGCNDLLYSGHMVVAVLTAMAWTEAYGGLRSVFIWMLVAHSAQREVRERHHYTVDCIVAIYVGFMLWKMTGFLWPLNNKKSRLKRLEKIESKLYQAAKDSDLDQVRDLLKQVDSTAKDQIGQERAM
ncbi:putative sphingomyelin synthase-like domain-containing protein [Helianthus anomalus]